MANIDTCNSSLSLEKYLLIWLENPSDSNEKNKQAQEQVRSSINHLQIYENVDECITNIRLSEMEKIIFVIDWKLSEMIIPYIHQLSQIIAIYIYGTINDQQIQFFNKYSKVKCLVLTVDDVVSKIEKDQNIRERKQTSPLFTIFDRSSTNINGSFLHSELIIDALVRMNSYPIDKHQLIEICRKQYKDNPAQLNFISEFERDYTSEQALWWYTRETFLYKILNATLRTQNVDLLILFQFLIQDIYQQLKQLQKNQFPFNFNRVYRGQLMSEDEIAILISCEGQLVSMNSFLSTTHDRNYALTIVESGLNTSNILKPVLFQIDLDQNLSDMKPYADISCKSAFQTENEVLIMLGSVFRLKNVDSENNGQSWIIHLSLSNDDQNEIRNLFDCMKIDAENENILYSLSYILLKSGNLTTAERCFRRYLTEQSEDSVNAAKTYQSLGSIFQSQGQYDMSLEMLNKAVHIFNKTLNYANPFIAITYSSIANLYLRKNDTTMALSYYERSLSIFKEIHGEDHSHIAMCYNNMGLVYAKEKNFDQALICYDQSYNISKKTLPSGHPNLAACLMNIGITYGHLKQYQLSLQYFEQSLQMKLLSLPYDHPDLADTYANMAAANEKQGHILEAISYYEKALNIFLKSLPSTHSKIVSTKKYIQRLKDIL